MVISLWEKYKLQIWAQAGRSLVLEQRIIYQVHGHFSGCALLMGVHGKKKLETNIPFSTKAKNLKEYGI